MNKPKTKTVQFGVIAGGLMFKFKGDRRNWFVAIGKRGSAHTFAADQNTKIHRDNIPFNEMVIVEVWKG